MKKNLVLFLLTIISAFCISFGLASCGNKSDSGSNSTVNGNTVSYATEHFDSLDLDAYSFKEHFYYIFKEHKNWQSAESYCENIGGHLATVANQEEQTLIEHMVKQVNMPCWLGGYKSGQNFFWITGEEFNYHNFRSGEKTGGNDYRVGIYANDYDTRYSQTFKWNEFAQNSTT